MVAYKLWLSCKVIDGYDRHLFDSNPFWYEALWSRKVLFVFFYIAFADITITENVITILHKSFLCLQLMLFMLLSYLPT